MTILESSIPGYQLLELLYDGSRTLVYRGQRLIEQKPVVIKLLKNPYPSFTELVQFRNQYTITKNLEILGIIRPYSLEPYQNSCILVMEDFGGVSLQEYTRMHSLSLLEFLAIAVQLSDILEAVYSQKVIHKDIKPANILIHPQSKQVKLIDFSIASLLLRENQEIYHANELEGTLAYISPEQTGRMNRGIDYRTDFYSLGITFYELLTGKLPFEASDAMELLHCHISKYPPLVSEINPEIPLVISEIVKKLIAKNAEERYQSALGLKHDLEICLHNLKEKGRIEAFEIGKQDTCDRFIIPEKLYGRATEVETLLTAFDRVANGATELMLVAGFSGIGKTAVINEVHKPIVKQRGYFIKGKFDQFQRNIPLSAFVQAFRDLIGQLLSQTDAQLNLWKTKILDVLGENAQVIIEVIPELELILGRQPSVAPLSGNAAQNRFNLLFQKFINVFTSIDHPLVIFVDDLQWADSASLNLIQVLLNESKTNYLLLIGAYRDNEVFPAHPLSLTLDELKKNNVILNTITLTPLSEINLNELVADTLNCTTQIALPLTQLIYHKTKGNPFFSTQFLKALHNDRLISFSCSTSIVDGKLIRVAGWECDISEVKAKALSDDVVEFMGLQLQKLPSTTQNALKLAACIGNQFDLATLAVVCENSQTETAAFLWKALQEGFILPTSEIYKFYVGEEHQINTQTVKSVNYRFLHDRVQQAAYFLIPESQKQATHLKIGQLLLKNLSEIEQEERLFEIVNQLNIGLNLISEQEQKNELALLNLKAGRKAKCSTAYTASFEYLTVGINLLAPDSWVQSYKLNLALHESAAESAYLSGNFEAMETLVEIVMQQAQTLLEKVQVYDVKIQAYAAQNNLHAALDLAFVLLKLLGVSFPEEITQADIDKSLAETMSLWSGKQPLELAQLPNMTEPEPLAAMQILSVLQPFAYQVNPQMFLLIILKQISLTLKYGNSNSSSDAYACYGFILCSMVNEIEFGYQFGELSLSLLENSDSKELRGKGLYITNGLVKHWKVHPRQTLKPLLNAYTVLMENGDFPVAGWAAYMYNYHSYFSGIELTELEKQIAAYSKQLLQIKQEPLYQMNEICRQAVLNLMGMATYPSKLRGDAYDEEIMLPLHQESNNLTLMFKCYFQKLILCYLFDNHAEALENSKFAEKYLDGVLGYLDMPLFHFYQSLTLLSESSKATELEKNSILMRVNANQQKMENWAHHAPQSHWHRFYLVKAEFHRVLGEKLESIEFYDKAIAGARANQYMNEEALANELAAKFYLQWDKEKVARAYMQDAYYCYARWGARAKTFDLEKHYPQLLQPILQQKQLRFNGLETISTVTNSTLPIHQLTQTFTSSSTSVSEALDFQSILKASQSLSGEIHLDKLLTRLLNTIIESGGATFGALVLLWDNQLWLEAIVESGKEPTILQDCRLDTSTKVPISLIYRVKHSLQTVAINDVTKEDSLLADSYIMQQQPKSLLCTPILNQGKLLGILYLENDLAIGAFTKERVEILKLLCTQAAISLENARLYQKSQNYAQQLEESLASLTQAQTQLVQSEKMSSLGNLVAGVAHEVNNPIGFLTGSLDNARDYIKDLLEYINCVQENYPQLVPDVTDLADEIDLEYLIDDLPKLISSMKGATARIQDISTSLRTFSRADTVEKVACNIYEGIDSTLLILKYRLKANEHRPAIGVVKAYGELPPIKCFLGQLNQVFMNILANAIDAIDEQSQKYSFNELEANPKQITITTEALLAENIAVIRIKDNGPGMSEAVKAKIFDHLFTTKGIGKGTGLGLAIAHQIVEKTHAGKIICNSVQNIGTEFIIELPFG